MAKPFIKWVGGKSQILDQINQLTPTKIDTYYELFVGGGSVFINLLNRCENQTLNIKKFVINDINTALIYCYNTIKNQPNELISKLTEINNIYSGANPSETVKRAKIKVDNLDEAISKGQTWIYYYYRQLYNQLVEQSEFTITTSALFIFLNKTCFRGLYRVSRNKFNVPFGHYKHPNICDSDNILELNKLFNKYNIEFINFNIFDINRVVIKGLPDSKIKFKKTDFLYFDPPYYPINKDSFVSYCFSNFNLADNDKLYELCNSLKCKFLLSNSYCDYITNKWNKYTMIKILCKRLINSKNPSDKNFEYLIHN